MKIKRFEFNMFPVNCYVLSDETREAVVIDAGCFYPGEGEQLKKYLDEEGLQLKHVLNTHLHLDHIFGNAYLAREFGLKPEANQADEFLLARAADHCRMFGFRINEEPAPLGGYIADGDEICFGNSRLKAIAARDTPPEVWCSMTKRTDACSAVTSFSEEASDGPTWTEEVSRTSETASATVCSPVRTTPSCTLVMESRLPSVTKRRTILISNKSVINHLNHTL